MNSTLRLALLGSQEVTALSVSVFHDEVDAATSHPSQCFSGSAFILPHGHCIYVFLLLWCIFSNSSL